MWRRGPGETIVAETEGLHLVVHPLCPAGYVRFVVVRPSQTAPDRYALLSSGSQESVQAAMRGAERAAARVALFRPPPVARPVRTAAVPVQPSFPLSGRRVLVVEDEWIIAHDLELALRKHGAEVAGPVPSLDRARAMLATEGDQLDGAVLDVNLRGQMVYPLADTLAQSGVPFVFATGYSAESIPERYAHVPRCYKPIDADAVVRALGRQLPDS
jgi:CheY-like chemotaxis protein